MLSLLAHKYECEIFRSPSQFGNHRKLPQFRVAGEWLEAPYSEEPLVNSPYGTLVNHHRGARARVKYTVDPAGQRVMSLDIPNSILMEKMRKPSNE